MKLRFFLSGYLFLALLGVTPLVSAQGLQGTVGPEFSQAGSPRANKAKFNLLDFYYRGGEGKKIPLTLYLKAFTVRLRPGVVQDNFTNLYKNDPRVAEFVDRSDLNLLIVQVKKEIQADKNRLLEMINEFNTSSPMVQFATPIVQSEKKTLILTDEFEVEFKSFVLPEEINAFNKKHYLERLTVEKRDNKYDLFVLQLTPASDKNILQMVHIYEEDDLVKHVQPRFLPFPKPIVVKTDLNPSVTQIGDPVLYQLQIIRSPDVQIEESLLLPGSINLKPETLDAKSFKILDDPGDTFLETSAQSQTEEGQVMTVKAYYLVFYATGEYEIPSVNVLYSVKKGEATQGTVETQEIKSDPIQVKVVSLLSQQMQDINGILPEASPTSLVEASSFSAYSRIFIGLALLIFSLAGIFTWLFLEIIKQSRRKTFTETSERDQAISELENLKEYITKVPPNPGQGTAMAFYEQVHRSFRRALGLFYGFNAESGSTSTVLRRLESLAAADIVQKGTRRVLQEYCDRRFLPGDLKPTPTQTEIEEIASTIQGIAQYFKEKTTHN